MPKYRIVAFFRDERAYRLVEGYPRVRVLLHRGRASEGRSASKYLKRHDARFIILLRSVVRVLVVVALWQAPGMHLRETRSRETRIWRGPCASRRSKLDMSAGVVLVVVLALASVEDRRFENLAAAIDSAFHVENWKGEGFTFRALGRCVCGVEV